MHKTSAGNHIRLNILDGLSIIESGRNIIVKGKKARAIIIYLALNSRKLVERTQIASLLWDESDAAKANNSMRQVVKEIRSISNEFNRVVHFEAVNINTSIDEIDVDIKLLIPEIESGLVREDAQILSVFNDSFLNYLDNISETYQDWLNLFRSDIRRRVSKALSSGADNSQLDWKARETLAEILVHVEPLNESACRVLIEAAARRGDVGTALTRYEKLYKLLDQEMGMEPTLGTQDLIVRIKLGDFSLTTPVVETKAVRAAGAGEPVVAIFPFRSAPLDGSQTRIGDLIADELICNIFALREIGVISSASTRSVLALEADVHRAAIQLNADYYLTGAITQFGESFRLSAQLARTHGGLVVWADTVNLDLADFPTAQSKIAQMITWQIVPSLRNTELRIASAYGIEQLTAYQLILRAQEATYRLDRASFFEAEELLRLAVEREPNFAAAYVAKADWHSLRLGQSWSSNPQQDTLELIRCAQTALRLGGMNGRALALLGHNRAIYSRAYDDALSLMKRATDLAPNDAETLMWSSPTYAYTGDHETAIRHAVRAIDLSPFDPLLFRYEHFASISHFSAGDYDEAVRYGLRSHERNPNYTSNIRVTVAGLMEQGRIGDARELAARVMVLEPKFTVTDFIGRQAFSDPARRAAFGRHLVRAGLPE